MEMVEEKVLKFRQVANGLYSQYEDLRSKLCAPYIIAMKGDPATGRKLVAFYMASILKCSLIKEHDFDNHEEKSEENQGSLWKSMCCLARSQLTSGRSVVLDTELADPNEFDQLKELSETTKTPLAVVEYRVVDVENLWNSENCLLDSGDSNLVMIFFTEFIDKPASEYKSSTNYNMGEIPRFLVEVEMLRIFDQSVTDALKDFRHLMDTNIESAERKNCNHLFYFINVEDEYKRRCCQCRQLVSGSVFRCYYCRFIVHGTCNYFPETLSMATKFSRVTLNLRHVVPELNDDAICSCCKRLLKGSTSSQYYSSNDGLSLIDLNCLFLLPFKSRTNIHEHELHRVIDSKQHRCQECDAVIDNGTIFYYCDMCDKSVDVYCLWLPETVEFDRHIHPFQISVVPREDPDPYYCEVCQEERDTDRWIYYCMDCEFPIHPRCIVKAACLPRYLCTDISTTNKKSNEKVTDTEFFICSSHLSTEIVMARELLRTEVQKVHLLFKESTEEIKLPIIIAVKGQIHNGRNLVSLALAAAFDCLLIDEDNLCEVTNSADEPKQVCYREFCQIALSQLQIGLSVVMDCDHSDESEFFILQDFAIATETPLFIVECKPCDEEKLEDFQRILNLCSDYEYKVGGTPKMIVNFTTPTFDNIVKFMPRILDSISSYSREWSKEHSKDPSCYRHFLESVVEFEVSEDDICDRCSKQLSTPILKCKTCGLVLHKTCTELPLHIQIEGWFFILEIYGDDNDKARCDCCGELVKGYAYNLLGGKSSLCLDLVCLFTPPKPEINLHKHPLQLGLSCEFFQCEACGSVCKQKLCYHCTDDDCSFTIGVNCGFLKETVSYDRHRHPFHLIISPEQDLSNQYYCDYCEVCQDERDNKHWVYCCVECEYYIHIHCLVPTGGCPPLES